MMNVKLLVLFVCLGNIRVCYCDYCKICPNHTLCMYKRPGPGTFCKSYDETALLTKEDVDAIVNKINQRRNFVALGLARNLPSAANMNEIRWSEELAKSAQRWVDQCDSAVRPDREDRCRDLENINVGQNIATVIGLSPGLNVKSFVEIWYMQALEYKGSVTYYNESLESKTNHFTQLIWADTTLVGCGKARFNVDDKGTMVDRLVCNFAPKGNVKGKPVYTIGYPATQCNENSGKDELFTGLCKSITEKSQRTTIAQMESSLIRILSLLNNSVRQDLNPIPASSNKYRQMNRKKLKVMKHQNLRHIPNYLQNLHSEIPIKHENIATKQYTPSRNYNVVNRLHTVQYSQNSYGPIHIPKSIEDYRRNNYFTIETMDPYYYGFNERRQTFSGLCTRNSRITPNTFIDYRIIPDHCTRKTKGNEYMTTTEYTTPHACNSRQPTYIDNPIMLYDCGCHCGKTSQPENQNQHHRRIPGEYVYYDYLPEMVLRDGEYNTKNPKTHFDDFTSTTIVLPQDQNEKKSRQKYYHGIKPFDFGHITKQRKFGSRRHFLNQNYPYMHAHYRGRQKRQINKLSSKDSVPKIDTLYKRPQKRSPRYTTLPSKMGRRIAATFRQMDSVTESITITTDYLNKHRHHKTDKSLSFDELMSYRKNHGGEVDLGKIIRRKNTKKATTPKKPAAKQKGKATIRRGIIHSGDNSTTNTTMTADTTTETSMTETTTLTTPHTTIAKLGLMEFTNGFRKLADSKNNNLNMTIIGSFSPVSQCTRRITCTWTRTKLTDAHGNDLDPDYWGPHGGGGNGGGGGGRSNRTPWGHVENCTRKFTCSRLYYNRNVQASDTAATEATIEDYCERRALDVKRKDFSSGTVRTQNYENCAEITSPITPSMNYENAVEISTNCFCEDLPTRMKRSSSNLKKNKRKCKCIKKTSHNRTNRYSLALGKILRKFVTKRCACNSNARIAMKKSIFFIYIFFTFTLTKYLSKIK